MSADRDNPKPARRQIFVLTPDEKRTVCFVLIVFLLGLATKSYRDSRPATLSKPTMATGELATPKPSRPLRP